MKEYGIIFDVDGTLWDSTSEVAVAWNQALAAETNLQRVLTSEELKKEFGKPLDVIVANLFPELTKEEQDVLSVHLFEYENRYVEKAACRRYEYLEETFDILSRKYPLFIVSNCQAGYIESFLKNTGLGCYVTDTACPGDTGLLKADNIRIIMKRNSLKQAVYVGDTQGDADACKAAGVPMIYAAYGFGSVEGDHITIHSLKDLWNIKVEDF